MDYHDYVSLLPSEQADPRDAIEALVDKLPSFRRAGLFEKDEFVGVFAEKLEDITNRLPTNLEQRKPLEIDLAHIIHDVQDRYGLIIAKDQATARLRTIENVLTQD
jgi:hypothetical protein